MISSDEHKRKTCNEATLRKFVKKGTFSPRHYTLIHYCDQPTNYIHIRAHQGMSVRPGLENFNKDKAFDITATCAPALLLRHQPDLAVIGAEKQESVERKHRHCGENPSHDVTGQFSGREFRLKKKKQEHNKQKLIPLHVDVDVG